MRLSWNEVRVRAAFYGSIPGSIVPLSANRPLPRRATGSPRSTITSPRDSVQVGKPRTLRPW